MALAISELVVPPLYVSVLPVVNAVVCVVGAVCVITVPSVSLSLLYGSSKTLYIFWLVFGAYSCVPVVFHSCNAVKRRVYASWMNVLRAGYVLRVIASQLSNSLSGKMPDCCNRRTALLIICVGVVYGSCARICISWHCLIL